MSDKPTCQEFQDRLEQLADRSLPGAEIARLEQHAAGCPACSMLIRVQRHVASTTTQELESAVPDHLVTGMWARVRTNLAAASAADKLTPPQPARWPWLRAAQSRSWLVPALAAGVVVLAFFCGTMWSEVRLLRQQRHDLVGELQRQQLQLAQYHDRTAEMLVHQTSALIGRAGWRQAIAGQDEFTAAELVALLSQLPPETPLLSESDTRGVLQRGLEWHRLSRLRIPRDVQVRDGLQADEVIRIIDELDLPPDQKISRSRLLSLTASRAPDGDR